MKVYVGMEVQLHSFLTSAIDGVGRRQAAAALRAAKRPTVSNERDPGWVAEPVRQLRRKVKYQFSMLERAM